MSRLQETADRAQAAEEEPVKERDFRAVAIIIGDAGGAGDGQDQVARQKDVFLGVGLELIDVGLARAARPRIPLRNRPAYRAERSTLSRVS